jgi:hypothetical protein
MEQQTDTVTDSDAVMVDDDPAMDRQAVGGTGEEEPQLARARDGQRTSSADLLPDTERIREAFADWWERARGVLVGLADGSFWDEQPPSPSELIERYKQSPWTHSEYGLLKVFRWLGCVFSVAWSLPLYALAIIGQRFGRALTVVLIVWTFWNLI